MKLSAEIKDLIKIILDDYSKKQYAHLTKEEQKSLWAFYTPAELVIEMIEKFDNLEGTICDPAAGVGNLLVGCILAGADPENIYAIEYDYETFQVLKKRLVQYGVPEYHIVLGDATDPTTWEILQSRVA